MKTPANLPSPAVRFSRDRSRLWEIRRRRSPSSLRCLAAGGRLDLCARHPARLSISPAMSDAELTSRISAIHQHSRATYGAPRIHEELLAVGIHVGRKRVARLMKAADLC